SSNSRNSCSTLRWSALIRATASWAMGSSWSATWTAENCPAWGPGKQAELADQELGAQPLQGAAQQPRHVHLGAADPCGDVVLVEVVEEAQDHDLAPQGGQALEQLGEQEQVLQLLAGGGRGQAVAQGGVALLADPLVERDLGAGGGGVG